jgi:hypothetical protein
MGHKDINLGQGGQVATRTDRGFSLAKGPAGIIGIIALAFGVLALIFGSHSFKVASVPSGDLTAQTFLGVGGNGWMWLLIAAGGALLLLAAPMHWGAKTMALIVGLAFGAASVIAIFDGHDVFGIFAANGLTELLLGIAAAVLLVVALLPRVGRGRRRVDEGDAVVDDRRREPAARRGDGRIRRDDEDVPAGVRERERL